MQTVIPRRVFDHRHLRRGPAPGAFSRHASGVGAGPRLDVATVEPEPDATAGGGRPL